MFYQVRAEDNSNSSLRDINFRCHLRPVYINFRKWLISCCWLLVIFPNYSLDNVLLVLLGFPGGRHCLAAVGGEEEHHVLRSIWISLHMARVVGCVTVRVVSEMPVFQQIFWKDEDTLVLIGDC